MSSKHIPSLKKLYVEQVAPALVKSRGYKNLHEVPKISKIVLNSGIDAEADKNQIADVARDLMWDFFYRLLAVALPTIRDFRGVGSKLDGQGNYNLGIQDFTIFPEITVENVKKTMGFDITIVTTANTDEEGRELLKLLGMPFRRTEQQVAADAAAAKTNAA